MIKMIFLLKRKAGMSRTAFMDRYENGHAKLAEPYLADVARYVRRYLVPQPDLFTGKTDEPDHDVITELWFESQQKLDATMQRLSQPDVSARISADEDEIFDRSMNRVFMVEEHDSPRT